MGCGVGHRHGSEPALLWLWCRLAAVALICTLAWEPPYAAGVALKKRPKKKKSFEQTHRYREQTRGYQWGEGRGGTWGGDLEVQTATCHIHTLQGYSAQDRK